MAANNLNCYSIKYLNSVAHKLCILLQGLMGSEPGFSPGSRGRSLVHLAVLFQHLENPVEPNAGWCSWWLTRIQSPLLFLHEVLKKS